MSEDQLAIFDQETRLTIFDSFYFYSNLAYRDNSNRIITNPTSYAPF